MSLEQPSQQEHEQLDYLLNCSGFSSSHKSVHNYELSNSKDKLNLSEKERTREQSYQDIIKHINQIKLEQTQLKKDLTTLKEHICHKHLGPFRDQLIQLNEQNTALRAELRQHTLKNKQDKGQKLSNRSSIKARSSINSFYGDQNKNSRTMSNQVSSSMLLKKKDAKLSQSTAQLGRNYVISPKHHKRRDSLLTQRKIEDNFSLSFNGSFCAQKSSDFFIKESISKQCLQQQPEQQNIFIQILEKMLKEELSYDNQKYYQLYLQTNRTPTEAPKHEVAYINTIQQELKETNSKLQMLRLIVHRYQTQIEGMNINLKNIEDLTSKLFQVKGRYVQMEKQCGQLIRLKKEVSEKEELLNAKQLSQINAEYQQPKTISSVQTLIKIVTSNPSKTFNQKSSKLYLLYYRQIKELFKFDKEDQTKRQQKLTKVKQIIDNIRQSRKKFNQLIQIYEGRINKLEEKISRVRQQQAGNIVKSSIK